MSEWQPIETARKDGTEIIVKGWQEFSMIVFWDDFVARFGNLPLKPAKERKGFAWHFFDGLEIRELPTSMEPTHWMPRP